MSEIVETAEPGTWIARQLGRIRLWARHKLGLDKAIVFTILGRGWASLAGLVTVALIARFLSPAEQGYYYTFGSLVALQIVFELGFSFVILQMAAHERAHLTISPDHSVVGDATAHDRLASVLQKTVRWYTRLAVMLAVSLLIAGSYFFSHYQHGGVQISWRAPWYTDALAATLTFQLDPLLSFMEGCGFIANVARTRLVQAITGSSLAWVALATHHGLYAPAMVIVGNASVASIWLFHYRHLLMPLLRRNPGTNNISWTGEVWAFQWRIAVSWLCGYFIYQLSNPVLFAYKGAVIAGQMGMSLSIANALLAVSMAWINTKAAPFGLLIARKEYSVLDTIFFRALRQSMAVFLIGAVLVWTGIAYLSFAHLRFAHRLLDPGSVAILLLGQLLGLFTFGQALYLRAHKQEKFLFNSVIGAVLVGCSTYFFGKHFGAFGIVSANLAIGLLFGLPLGTFIFLKYRRIWHAE